jgi:tetratricopeptide (TPR) repeat protein
MTTTLAQNGGWWHCSRRNLLSLILLCAGLAAYHNSFEGPFFFDDRDSITNNPHIRDLTPPWLALRTPQGKSVAGRPIVNLSFAVNYALGGLRVWGYHALNLAIHLSSALLLFGIVRRTLCSPSLRDCFGDRAAFLAFAVALLWMLHPLQTESVTYIIQRTESLMGLFYLMTLYCVIRGFESTRSSVWYVAAVASSGLGMASKEVMVTAPVVVLLYDRAFHSGSLLDLMRKRRALYAGLCSSWIVLLLLVAGGPRSESAGFGLQLVTPWEYARTQPVILVHYLKLALWPDPLILDYSWKVAPGLRAVLPQAALVLALLAETAWALVRRPWLGFLGAGFFIILSPTSSIVPIADLAFEHRMYLPLACVLVLVVVGVELGVEAFCRRFPWSATQGPLLKVIALAVVASSFTLLTIRRNHEYRTEVAIWQATVETCPDNPRAHNNLGFALFQEGRTDEAIVAFNEALRLAPDHEMAHYNLGVALAAKGEIEKAIVQYMEELKYRPNAPHVHLGLGLALAAQGRQEDAIVHYLQAVSAEPKLADAHFNLGNAYAELGRRDLAVEHYSAALRIDPDHADAHSNLGMELAAQGRLDEAIAQYREAIRLNPYHVKANYNMGVAFASQRKFLEASACYQRALHLKPDYDKAHYNLAQALAAQGKPEEALVHYREAMNLMESRGNHGMAKTIRGIIQQIQSQNSGVPYR